MDKFELYFDYHNPLFLYLAKIYDPKHRCRVSKKIVQSITHKYFDKNTITNREEALKIIHELQNSLENEMRNIISKKSIYYWFHLYRRIAPVPSFNNESSFTVWLYRNIMEVAFLKYGKLEISSELVIGTYENPLEISKIASGNYVTALKYYNIDSLDENMSNKVIGIFLGDFDLNEFNEIYSLECLAYEFWWTTVYERRLNKDGILHVKYKELFVTNDEEINELMKIYDSRGHKYDDLVTTTGIPLNFKNNSNMFTMLPKYNTDGLSIKVYPYHKAFGLPYEMIDLLTGIHVPNFIWIPFDFEYFYIAHKFMEKDFEEKYNFSLKEFVFTCYFILHHAILVSLQSETRHPAIELMKRSYKFIISIDDYIEEILELSKKHELEGIISDQINLSREQIVKIIEELTFESSKASNISLKTMGPRYLIVPLKLFENNYLIDYAALLPILLTITHFVPSSHEIEKGSLFEEYVIKKMKDNNFNIWVSQKEIKQEDGTSKEIDVSFIYKNVLFICECKSNKMSLVYGTIGDKVSLEHRRKKMTKALKEVDEKAEWLAKSKTGSNYKIPEEIDCIIPLVISPFTEYIWDYSEYLWLTSNIPRILLPSEIINFEFEKSLSSLVTKKYAKKFKE